MAMKNPVPVVRTRLPRPHDTEPLTRDINKDAFAELGEGARVFDETLLANNPPPAVRDSIDAVLRDAAIRRRENYTK